MTLLFYLAFAATIFFGLALAAWLYFTRTPRATMQRIREVTYRGRSYRRSAPVASDTGRKLLAILHWVRARLGLADDADLPERLANAGYKGTFPVDAYNAARILGPLLALVAGSFIPFSRTFWMMALPAAGFIAPNVVLTRLIKRRREKIRRSIP